MSASEAQSACPRCGKNNLCQIDSATPCWCATTFKPALPPALTASCYCAECLPKVIAEYRAAAPSA